MSTKTQTQSIRMFTLSLLFVLCTSCTRDDVSVEPWKIDETKEMSGPDLSSMDASEDLSEMGPTALSLAKLRACVLPEPPQECRIQRADEFGDCGMALGAVFDGTQCVPVTGCACTGDDCPLFESVAQCASACSAQGWCQSDKLSNPSALPVEPQCRGFFCGTDFAVCINSDIDPIVEIGLVAPSLASRMWCRRGGDICSLTGSGCSAQQWCCHKTLDFHSRTLDAAMSTEACAISLMSTSSNISCLSFE